MQTDHDYTMFREAARHDKAKCANIPSPKIEKMYRLKVGKTDYFFDTIEKLNEFKKKL